MSGLSDALVSLPEAVFADVLESDEAYLLIFDFPGVTRDGIQVTATGARLSIEARRQKDVPEDFWFREEGRALFLDVDVPVPPDAVGNQATARLDSGVLEITIPKVSEAATQVPIEE
ncbi:Hsp20/alpha crystallin family protein [Halanaeroarchaeum sulfurireducens]|uniref:Heat shock protein Hsp20 n=1 Tax=Halanaeroarchaeum sulfurireducens TaxID=1604004 RepID=A0A0F7PAY5_9EURY|nr:Hsp20/alpha crystallin family protein [Halanaeroarchaeum sulfurireducens]AKH98316.1 heat shock protein Hsp20 [Halanaeroarchaeum sulfurireducens]ALG82710.1 heat shock protein Hsp20 [Halanaeroarchaeum sulfurireducens]